jgi:hypothetical protein
VLAALKACSWAATGPLELLYKAEVGTTVTEKAFASSYDTVFMHTALDPEDATISPASRTASTPTPLGPDRGRIDLVH